eukprot:CAMPEP_0175009210 /NCGR_PEP_ID=MMETSP0005-20121125/7392_1 /TAXON_ID=420556 /ORGANISM="Ochromonas sp., Strain CCMP1393" /LENGTH=251 /DNA_ID=CAMNT_0016264841 /DNA_START=1 /DNA_END=753 /DNA_ORIENTATION=+
MGISYLDHIRYSFENIEMPKSSYDSLGYSVDETFLNYVLLWTIVVSVLHLAFTPAMEFLFPVWHKELTPRKRHELPSYSIGLLHHVVVSPVCLWQLYSDFMIYAGNDGVLLPFAKDHYDALFSNSGVYPFSMGFFIADTLFYSIPEAIKGAPLYLLHHLVAILLQYACLTMSHGTTMLVFPVMMATEVSSIFFNTAWILRSAGYRSSTFVSTLETLFALSFLLLRNVHASIVIFAIWDHLSQFGWYQIPIW